MLRNVCIFIFINLFTFTTTAVHAGVEKGDKTITIFGALQSDDFSDTLIAQIAGGLFVNNVLEIQGTALLISNDGAGNKSSLYGFGANGNLYLPMDNPDLAPYFGAGAQLLLTDFADNSDTEIALNIQAGIKQFLSENITINYQGQFITSSGYDASILSVGFTIFLE